MRSWALLVCSAATEFPCHLTPLDSWGLLAFAGVTEDDNLPANLKRNLTTLRELDQQAQELFERMQKLSKAHIARAKRSVQEGRDPEDDLLVKARKAYKDLMEVDEEKVLLADNMSNEINRHYEHCASELRKFEEELKEKGQLKTPQMKSQQLSRQDSATSAQDDGAGTSGAGSSGYGAGGQQPGDGPGAVGAAGRRGRNTGDPAGGGGPPSGGGNSHKRGRGRKVSFKEAERQRLLAEQETARQQQQQGPAEGYGGGGGGGGAPPVPMNYPDPELPLASREESNNPLCGAVPAPSDYIIAEGTKVCAKPPSTKMQPQDWILGTVVKYVAVTHKYVIQDEDDSDADPWAKEASGTPSTHNVPGRMVIPLPLSEPSHYTPYNEFARGVWILALYPDTTCFYKALVHTPPSQMGGEPPRDYLVEFEDEGEPTGRGEAIRCPQRYVLALPQ